MPPTNAEFWIVNWSTDHEGICDHIDPDWRRITGQNVKSALGKGWLDAIHVDERDLVHAKLTQALHFTNGSSISPSVYVTDPEFKQSATASPRRVLG
jgi:PAS domain-containing protein